jgi:hypothetical protein
MPEEFTICGSTILQLESAPLAVLRTMLNAFQACSEKEWYDYIRLGLPTPIPGLLDTEIRELRKIIQKAKERDMEVSKIELASELAERAEMLRLDA